MPEAGPLWFSGICDSLLMKVYLWARDWGRGEEAATRTWLSPRMIEEKIVTKRAARIGWKKVEFENLIRILTALRPNWILTADLKAVFERFDRAKLLPGNERELIMVAYQQDPIEILQVLLQAKSGQAKAEAEIEERIKTGQPLWG